MNIIDLLNTPVANALRNTFTIAFGGGFLIYIAIDFARTVIKKIRSWLQKWY
jgi:hypothetical protein